MVQDRVTTKRGKDGFYDFYFRGKNVTALWLDFFSTLSWDKEKKCEELFIKKYRKLFTN